MKFLLKYAQAVMVPLILIVGIAVPSQSMAKMKPLKDKEGRYSYPVDPAYPVNGAHEHYTVPKGLKTLAEFLGEMPARFISKLWIWCSSKQKEVKKPKASNPVDLLKPLQTIPDAYSMDLKITWIGHATFLIQINGVNILTDPIFGDIKVGLIPWVKRDMPPGIKLEDLPHIDVIVISHAHSDHMDTDALTFCNEKFKSVVCVPEGNGRYVAEMGFSKKRIVEKTWWEDVTIANKRGSVQITCLPARHWSIRFNPNDCCKSLWSSWMIGANEQHVYFAGDTAYGQHFKEIAQEFPSIDLALLPTGPTEEHDTNRCDHTDAIQAVQAFQDLNARVLTPMHYGVFWNKPSTIDLPVKRLNECWECKKEHGELADKELLVARCGQEYNF